MRFVFATTLEGSWGGSEWLWADTARVLLARRHQVAVVLPWLKQHSAIAELSALGAVIHAPGRPVRFWRRWGRVLLSRRTPRPLEEALSVAPTDLIILSQDRQDRGAGFTELLAGKPYVVVNQLVAEHVYWEDRSSEAIARLYRGARANFFVAPGNLHVLERNLGEVIPRAQIVRNPFRVPYDQPSPMAMGDPAVFSMVARLDPDQKGHDLLFEVLSRPSWSERAWQVECFGVGSAFNRLQRQIAALGLTQRIHLRGHVENVASIWRRTHVALVPSRCEGTPIALVEAMLCGRPAVATDVGGNADFVRDLQSGWLAPAAHPDLINEALERMWADRANWPARGLEAARRARELVPPDPASVWADHLTQLALVR